MTATAEVLAHYRCAAEQREGIGSMEVRFLTTPAEYPDWPAQAEMLKVFVNGNEAELTENQASALEDIILRVKLKRLVGDEP